jgi:hypothetical protein
MTDPDLSQSGIYLAKFFSAGCYGAEYMQRKIATVTTG